MKIFLNGLLAFIVLSFFSFCHAQQIPKPHTPSLKSYDKVGRVPTLNRMGWMHPVIDSITQKFLDFCKTNPDSKVLEIRAAYGYASKEALLTGVEIWVNDLDMRHLILFEQNLPPNIIPVYILDLLRN